MSETLSTDSERCSPEHTFYCGVVEGFYGKPWSFSQRKELFRRMKRWSMNTYVYAPKDDSKHRLHWRETYTQEELSHLRCLIQQAYENDILFVYAISPGLDMHYSKLEEIELLKRKIKQVTDVGCQALAFLFDDIEAELCSEDKEKFASPAHAHVFVTNELYECFGHPTCFFCPTEYCTTRAVPSLSQSATRTTPPSALRTRPEGNRHAPPVRLAAIQRLLSPNEERAAVERVAAEGRRLPLHGEHRVQPVPPSLQQCQSQPRLRSLRTRLRLEIDHRASPRLLPIMSAPGAPFARPIAVPVFTIRPYMQSDHDVLREFCEKHFLSHALVDGEALISFPSLAIDSSIGDYIALSSDLIFVLDTTGQLCGYACGALNAQQHRTGAQSTWKPQMAVKYPAGLLDSELHPSIKILIEAFHSDRGRGPLLPEDIYEQYPSIVTMAMTQESLNLAYLPFSLLSALINCLRGQGSHGVHTVLSAENRVLHECFTSQGFTELMRTADGAVILGRSIERFP